MEKQTTTHYKALVLEGGGAKGIGYNGLAQGLEEKGLLMLIKHFAGSSIGGFFSLLFALGYSAQEVNDFIMKTDFSKLVPFPTKYDGMFSWVYDTFSTIAVFESALLKFGFYKNSQVVKMVLEVIEQKLKKEHSSINAVDLTFSQLYQLTGNWLLVTSTNINKQRTFYFSPSDTPDFHVYEAVSMSMNFPGEFIPISHDGDLWTDGGVGDNFPLKKMTQYFPRHQILGVNLITPDETDKSTTTIYDGRMNVNSPIEYLGAIINTMFYSRQNSDLYPDYWLHTIPLHIESFSILRTKFTLEQKEKIRDKCLDDTRKFFLKLLD